MPLDNLRLDDEKAAVLVVDDTPAILQLLELALGIDYEIVTADSGPRALELFQERHFDLVLLDLLMPGMNGFDTLKALQKLPNFAGTPVIFLTAMDDLASECNALELGADDYITKPFKPNLVRLRIGNILHRVRLQQRLSLALAGADQGLWHWNLETDEVRISSRWSTALSIDGVTEAHQLQGWQALAQAEGLALIEQAKAEYLNGQRSVFEVDVRLRSLENSWHWFNIYGKKASDCSMLGAYRNIDARKSTELALRESEERLRQVMDATGEGIWDWEVLTPVVRHNAAWSRIFGLGEEATDHETEFVQSLVHPEDIERIRQALADCLSRDTPFVAEYRMRHANGWYLWISAKGRVVERTPEGVAVRMVGALQDISESKRIEEEYRRLALFDTLTGLPNRRLLIDRLQQAIAQNRRNATLGALMFIDLDRFKEVNDTLGHDHGDQLLIEVGNRLNACLRKMDTVARLGGDEFVLMLPQLASDSVAAWRDAEAVATKVQSVLGKPYRLGVHSHESTPSIGLTLFTGAGEETVDAILKRADDAMYESKRSGRNRISRAPMPQPENSPSPSPLPDCPQAQSTDTGGQL